MEEETAGPPDSAAMLVICCVFAGGRLQRSRADRGAAAHQGESAAARTAAAQLSRTWALILSPPQKQKAQKKMDFLTEVEENMDSLRELKAAHAETIQELQKTRKILTMESRISKDYRVSVLLSTFPSSSSSISGSGSVNRLVFASVLQLELEQMSQKMNSDQQRYEEKLEQQEQLLESRAARISKLEGRDLHQLRQRVLSAALTRFLPPPVQLSSETWSTGRDGSRSLQKVMRNLSSWSLERTWWSCRSLELLCLHQRWSSWANRNPPPSAPTPSTGSRCTAPPW